MTDPERLAAIRALVEGPNPAWLSRHAAEDLEYLLALAERVPYLEQQLANQRHQIDRFASGTLLGKHGMEQADRIVLLEQDLKDCQQQLADQQERYVEIIGAARDVLVGFQKDAGYILGQVFSTKLTEAEHKLAEGIRSLDTLLQEDRPTSAEVEIAKLRQQFALTEQERNLRLNTDESVKLRHIAEVILPDVQRQLVDRTADREQLQKQLDTLHGRKFSERVYYVMLSRAERAEADREQALKELAEARLRTATALWPPFKTLWTTLVEFGEQTQRFFCRVCRYHATLGSDGDQLHDENCPLLALWEALEANTVKAGTHLGDLDHVLHPKP